jgi:outer membrane lipoprotein
MRKLALILLSSLVVVSCSPVFDRKLMKEGAREFDPRHLIETPDVFKEKLFIFGGVIVATKLTAEGSLIEALFVPVDRYGNLEDAYYQGRFLALYPASKGMLDPLIYKKGREITVAADFTEVRRGKIDEMDVVYPVFTIRQIHLWDEYRTYPTYYWPGYYTPYPYYPYMYDPWWRPYPGPYWPPPPSPYYPSMYDPW